jgi:carnitine-CoA ligase
MPRLPAGAAPVCGGKPISPVDFGVDHFTVPAVLDRRAEEFPDRVMMSIADVDITFEQMRQRSLAAANDLLDLGIRAGDCVALFTATRPEGVYFWLGAARIGAVTAAVNVASKGEFLLHALRLSQAKAIITDAERRSRVDEVADRLSLLSNVAVVHDLHHDWHGESLNRRITRAAMEHPGRSWGHRVAVFHLGYDGRIEAVATTWHYLFTAAATAASAWKFGPSESLAGRATRT